MIFDENVIQCEENRPCKEIKNDDRNFKYFPFACYAANVTLRQSSRPPGGIAEGKACLSGKHKRYGYKIEISVLPLVITIGCTTHSVGPVPDLKIF